MYFVKLFPNFLCDNRIKFTMNPIKTSNRLQINILPQNKTYKIINFRFRILRG